MADKPTPVASTPASKLSLSSKSGSPEPTGLVMLNRVRKRSRQSEAGMEGLQVTDLRSQQEQWKIPERLGKVGFWVR